MKYPLPANWYDRENTLKYLSHSQIKAFEECPAKELARIRGDYKPEDKRAFVVGRYVDCMLTEPAKAKDFRSMNRLDLFKEPTIKAVKQAAEDLGYPESPKNKEESKTFLQSNPHVHEKIGERFADIEIADAMVLAAQEDPQMREILKGQGQVRMVGQVGDCLIRCILDVYRPERNRFVDLKTAKDLEDSWDPELRMRVPPWESWNYWRQLALYQRIIEQNTGERMTPVLAFLTKQDPPDRLILSFEGEDNQSRLDREVEDVEGFVPQIMRWKSGEDEAPMCEKNSCDYCRHHKKTKIMVAISYR